MVSLPDYPVQLQGFVCDVWPELIDQRKQLIAEMNFPTTKRRGGNFKSGSTESETSTSIESVTKSELVALLDRTNNDSWFYLDYKNVGSLFSDSTVELFNWRKMHLPKCAQYVRSYKFEK